MTKNKEGFTPLLLCKPAARAIFLRKILDKTAQMCYYNNTKEKER